MSKRAELRRKARDRTPQRQDTNFSLFLVAGMAALAIVAIIALALTRPQGTTGATTSTTGTGSQSTGAQPYPEVARIGLAEARGKVGQPGVVFVDVRSVQEYNEGHIQGAVSLPLPELPARFAELPRDAALITYCT